MTLSHDDSTIKIVFSSSSSSSSSKCPADLNFYDLFNANSLRISDQTKRRHVPTTEGQTATQLNQSNPVDGPGEGRAIH